jgi:hypothetical protein
MEKCGVRGLALSLIVKQSNGHAIPIALWNGTVPIANAKLPPRDSSERSDTESSIGTIRALPIGSSSVR